MEQINELIKMMQTALPMLTEFIEWKKNQELEERAYKEEQTESQREFAKWLKEHQAEQAQEAHDAEELKKEFFGGENWQKNHLFPKQF
jgi:hypothetical protein